MSTPRNVDAHHPEARYSCRRVYSQPLLFATGSIAFVLIIACTQEPLDLPEVRSAESEESFDPDEYGSEFLEPEQGVWASFPSTDPYYVRASDLLLGEHLFRKCQMVFLPSFQNEAAVYIVREEGAPAVVVSKELRPQLWFVLSSARREKRDTEKREASAR